jgi:hypothetical protein
MGLSWQDQCRCDNDYGTDGVADDGVTPRSTTAQGIEIYPSIGVS